MIINKTMSVCPNCMKELQADIVEVNGSAFMYKQCFDHGRFEVKIAKNAWYYKGLISFYNDLFPENFSTRRICDSNVLFVTHACNLNCPICFTDAGKEGGSPDVSLNIIREYLYKIRNTGKIIRLSGGEPTLRNDLPQIIRLISDSGNYPYMFTNGLKLNNFAYLKILKESGLRGIIMWLDSLTDDRIHQLIRGASVLCEKAQAINNIKKLKIPFCLYHVKVKGVNDSELDDIWEYASKNNFVKSIWIKSYAHLGRKGFSRENEFVIDELVEEIIRVSKGGFSLEDMYYYQKFNYMLAALGGVPSCYNTQVTIMPRRYGRGFCFSRYAKLIDEFGKIWKDSEVEARKFFRYHVVCQIQKYMPVSLLFFLIRRKLSKQPMYKAAHEFLPSGYIFVIVNTFYNAWNYDKTLVYRQCTNGVFNLDPERNVPLCDQSVRHFS